MPKATAAEVAAEATKIAGQEVTAPLVYQIKAKASGGKGGRGGKKVAGGAAGGDGGSNAFKAIKAAKDLIDLVGLDDARKLIELVGGMKR
jgi:hypothetical protein